MGATIDASDLRRGAYIEMDGVVYEVVEYFRHKPGKGPTSIKTKIRNVKLDTTIDRTFDAFTKLQMPDIEQKDMQYLYKEKDNYIFMDTVTYEQVPFKASQLGWSVKYLKENITIYAILYKGEPIGIKLPTAIDLKVIETVPGIKGDTVAGGSKPATLETNLVIQVPLFINIGDTVRVDTRTGEYLERV